MEQSRISASDYGVNDPKGWCGDPRRGAALGRPSVQKLPRDTAARFTLRRVRLDRGGYDRNGTYFGRGQPLYWYACADAEGELVVDSMIRANDRADAMARVRSLYPNARFYGERRR